MTAPKMTLDQLRAKLRGQVLPVEAPKQVEALKPIETPKQVETPRPVIAPKVEPKVMPRPIAVGDSNREAWLTQATAMLRERLTRKSGLDLPEFAVSVGFGFGRRGTARLVGHTVPGNKTRDGKAQVYVTPIAATAEQALTVLTVQALTVLSLSIPNRPTVLALGSKLGLVPHKTDDKNASPFIANDTLKEFFQEIETKLGAYPHSAVKVEDHEARDSAVKVSCPVTDYKVRMANSWLKKFGAPICPCCNKPMQVEAK